MKKFSFLFLLAFIVSPAFAQNCYWANGAGGAHNDYGNAIATDASGNQYVTGSFESATITFGSYTLTNANNNSADFFLVKYNSAHTVVWAKRVGSALEDAGYGVAVDGSGNVFATGAFFGDSIKFSSTVFLVNNNLGNADFFLVKYDSNGNPVWAKRGAGGSSDEIGRAVTTDGVGNIYATGYFFSPTVTFGSTTLTNSGSGIDMFFVKFNSSGVPQWAKSAGGAGAADYGRGISADNAGDVWVTGSFAAPTITFGSTTLTNRGGDDVFLTKYNTSGVEQWSKSASGNLNDAAWGLVTDASGNAYITGGFHSPALSFGTDSINNINANYYDCFLAKYNSAGTYLWVKGYGGIQDDIGYGVTLNAAGDVLATGKFESSYIVFGNDTLTNAFPGTPDLFVVNYNSSGTEQWSAKASGATWGYAIATDNNANVYVTGTFMGTPSFGSTVLNSGGGYDYFVADIYPFTPTISSATNVSCYGGSNGTATETNIGGNSPFTYLWNNSQTTPTAINLSANNYTVTVTDANGCAHAATTTITQPAALALSFTAQNVDCSLGQLGSIAANVSGGIPAYTYLWNNTQTTQTISNLSAGTYSVTATDANNCTISNSVTITAAPAPVPAICMVTVDPVSQYNVIVWDKTPYTDIDSFMIYRETATNIYQRIGAVPYDSLSQFIDTVRTLYFPNTGDPNAGTYRYKIGAEDSCGNISLMSPYHNTIFISQNGGTFSWPSLYTIENGPNPVLNYVLLRDNISNGTWIPVSSVAGTQQTVSDPSYATYAGTASWRVQTFWNITCTPTYRLSSPDAIQSLNSSYSNIQGNFVPLGINNVAPENEIKFYPTINDGNFTLEVPDFSKTRIEIYSALGELVYSSTLTNERTEINLPGMSKGIYLLHVISANGIKSGKIIVE